MQPRKKEELIDAIKSSSRNSPFDIAAWPDLQNKTVQKLISSWLLIVCYNRLITVITQVRMKLGQEQTRSRK